ncbi:MAG: hypothetical protein MZV49_01345 [Rhodopseudomonas palustris]|nr:hypothetical protein [Rhodopseudomonas palustris]
MPKVDRDPSTWTKTQEYQEKNFAREALTINPAKACQPLGAVFAAVGFEKTLPFVHGSQGCVAYYRSHLSTVTSRSRPRRCPSSMTEDAAVFGGLNNMIDGLANAYALYQPKMIAVSTTCMAEVIGDDLNAFIKNAKEKGSVPNEFAGALRAHPGLRRQPRHRLRQHASRASSSTSGTASPAPWTSSSASRTSRSTSFGGFDGYTVGNLREVKRHVRRRWASSYTILGDTSDVWDTPTDGEFRMYDGGTTLERGDQCRARQGHHFDAGILQPKRPWRRSPSTARKWSRSTIPMGVDRHRPTS